MDAEPAGRLQAGNTLSVERSGAGVPLWPTGTLAESPLRFQGLFPRSLEPLPLTSTHQPSVPRDPTARRPLTPRPDSPTDRLPLSPRPHCPVPPLPAPPPTDSPAPRLPAPRQPHCPAPPLPAPRQPHRQALRSPCPRRTPRQPPAHLCLRFSSGARSETKSGHLGAGWLPPGPSVAGGLSAAGYPVFLQVTRERASEQPRRGETRGFWFRFRDPGYTEGLPFGPQSCFLGRRLQLAHRKSLTRGEWPPPGR